jgi:hypothetical protein
MDGLGLYDALDTMTDDDDAISNEAVHSNIDGEPRIEDSIIISLMAMVAKTVKSR